jgi:Family of unknown function (DUF6228)
MTEGRIVEFSDERERALVRLSYSPLDEEVGTLLVEMRAEGLVCERGVESHHGDGLDAFLKKLGHDWKGWRGTRKWETFRGELSIDATHEGRVVELLFVLWVPYHADTPFDRCLFARLLEEPSGELERERAVLLDRVHDHFQGRRKLLHELPLGDPVSAQACSATTRLTRSRRPPRSSRLEAAARKTRMQSAVSQRTCLQPS